MAHYGIETDLQISADGEAIVHHDPELGGLMEGFDRLDQITAAALEHARLPRQRRALDHARRTLRPRGRARAAAPGNEEPLRRRPAPAAAGRDRARRLSRPSGTDHSIRRSFTLLRQKAPHLRRGIVAAKYRSPPYWDQMPLLQRYGMGFLLPAALTARPHSSLAVNSLPAIAPATRHALCLPVLTWVVRSEAERARAMRLADQIIFEGFRP